MNFSKVIYINDVTLNCVDNYLGIILDHQMTLIPLLSKLRGIFSNRMHVLCKLRRYITQDSAVSIYKQTISTTHIFMQPFYWIYILTLIQNDALHTCYNVQLRDRITTESMYLF